MRRAGVVTVPPNLVPFRRGTNAPLRAVAAALAVILSCITTDAPAQTPRLTMIGLGAGVSCAEWVATAPIDAALEQWAFGFASAIAAGAQLQSGVDPLTRFDAPSFHAWLADHCRQRPTDTLSVALVRLVFSGGPEGRSGARATD
jgi:hypothetical protein